MTVESWAFFMDLSMADIFTVTAPLMIRLPDGERRALAEIFPHEHGLIWCDLYWHRMSAGAGVHLVEGELRGDGPWRIGDHRFYLLGCQGTSPELAVQWQQWRDYLDNQGGDYPDSSVARKMALFLLAL